MTRSPMQLERSFIPVLRIEADPEPDQEQGEHDVRVIPSVGITRGEQRLWNLQLDLSVSAKAGGPKPPYRIHMLLVGVFSFADQSRADDDIARLVAVNGTSILYSQAREFILLLTSRGPWGPYQLPTVGFTDLKLTRVVPPAQSGAKTTAARRAARSTRKAKSPA